MIGNGSHQIETDHQPDAKPLLFYLSNVPYPLPKDHPAPLLEKTMTLIPAISGEHQSHFFLQPPDYFNLAVDQRRHERVGNDPFEPQDAQFLRLNYSGKRNGIDHK